MTEPPLPSLPYQAHEPASRWEKDRSHLQALAVCHYVWGPLLMLFSSFAIIHIVLGVMTLRNPGFFSGPQSRGQPMPREIGWLFVIMGSAVVLFGWTWGILTILSGRFIARQRHRTFSLVIAAVNCLSVPIGTALGVFTFVLLLRESVGQLYAANRQPLTYPPPPPLRANM